MASESEDSRETVSLGGHHEEPVVIPTTAELGSLTQPKNYVPMSAAVFDAFLHLNRSQKPKLVENPMDDVLNPAWLQTNNLFAVPRLGMISSVVTPSSTSVAAQSSNQWSRLAAQRLRHSNLVQTDDQVRWQALRKLKTIILMDPSASKLGRTMTQGVRMFTSETDWEASFTDAFQGKSTATLAKRAGALWRYNEWAVTNDLPCMLQSSEAMIYRYVGHLKSHGSPTTATAFLQAWTFLHHSVGLLHCPLDDLLSSRVRGAARACLALKRPLQQAYPLTAKMIVALENVVTFAPYDHWKIIAGHMLMCLGSCSRFGDSIHLASLSISSYNGLQVIEGESKSFKTSQNEERRLRLLPIISLGKFFSRTPWAESWMKLRDDSGLGVDPALPAFSEITMQWLERRMTTGEAALYLKEFLVSSGFTTDQLAHIGCHSLKTTLLSWVAKGNYLGVPDRLVMGHHMSRENQSAVAYSRDELTRIMVVIHKMLHDVKAQTFKPDATRAERLFSAVANEVGCEPNGIAESDSDASLEEVELANFAKQDRPSWDDLPLDVVTKLRIHKFSGVVHIIGRDPRTFQCGRSYSKNFQQLSASENFYDIPICLQCRPADRG